MQTTRNRLVIFEVDPTDSSLVPSLALDIVEGTIVFRGYPYDIGEMSKHEVIKLRDALTCYIAHGHFPLSKE